MTTKAVLSIGIGSQEEMKMAFRRVKVGARYVYNPVPFDQWNPPFDCQPGAIVKVVNLPGCPKANSMGMCHIERNGRFAGMVCTNSLHPVSSVLGPDKKRNRNKT